MEEPKEVSNTNPESEEEQEDFEQLMESYSLKAAETGTHIDGKIIDIIDNKVIVDIGQKTEGILDKAELNDWDGGVEYNLGDTIRVVCKNINMREGYITVSKRQVDIEEGWDKVKRAYEKKTPLMGRILEFSDDKRGFKVDMGVSMFLPLSQVDIKKVKNPKGLIGKKYSFKVSRINSKEMTGVLSRRTILEDERKEKINRLFDELKVGDLVTGTVTTLTDYGAFINLGPVDGLVHKDNISYGRVNHPKEKLRKGDEIEARVLDLDKGNTRISLGIKQKSPDPWINIEEKYPVGKRLVAKATKIVDFGAFIELEEGVEGLLHISDLTWESKPGSVEEYVAVGEKIWVQIIELKPGDKKIKLGLKQLEMRPEEKYVEKLQSGDILKGKVKKILKSRVFVELEKGVEGVIKISDISYFRIDSPEEFMREGETIDVMVLSDSLDSNYKVRLGLKQLSDDEWNRFFAQNKPRSVIPIKIKKIGDRGITVEISKNIEGFVRLNEVDEKKLSFEEIQAKFNEGDSMDAQVLMTDPEKKRIYLSFRAAEKAKEREEIAKYSKSENESVTTIGDLFESAIVGKEKNK
ncbi:MAG: S1 RNA-binding domain-containing protein [Candidatus Aminicenantes bacterium]|nr:S1 RNA-binding domain-containing protein [Candidatus Aminicenantes bacterium]